jgi:hypothetical protein
MRAYLATLYDASAVRRTFANELGDTIDCVDFRAQPGIRLGAIDPDRGRPPSLDMLDEDELKPVDGEEGVGVALQRSCPVDTVSLRHYTVEELAEYESLEVLLARNHDGQHTKDVDYGAHEHAEDFFVANNWGATTTLNVWNPPDVEAMDFSLSQMWVTAGERPNQQTLEAGWIAGRDVGKDKLARLFIYSTPDGYSTGCYDVLCEGFVKMAAPMSHVVLGGRFSNTSTYHGIQYAITLRWQRCPASTCGSWEGWWLKYGVGSRSEWVGFYPRSRFDSARLADQAERISFGGEVARPNSPRHTTTDMGSGKFPDEGFGGAAYQRNMRMIAPGNTWQDLPTDPLFDIVNPRCYDHGTLAQAANWGEYFFFGGPGRNPRCP